MAKNLINYSDVNYRDSLMKAVAEQRMLDKKKGNVNTTPLVGAITPTSDPFFIDEITASQLDLGHSKFDKYLTTDALDYNESVNDIRADLQSTADKWGNALVNNVAILGTSLVDNTLGLGWGVLEAALTLDASKIWDNAITNATAAGREAVQNNFTNYRSSEYEDSSIWSKLGTAQFWADFVQNLAYAEAAMITGGGVGSLIKNAPSILRKTVPSLTAAMGEASTEAISWKRENTKTKHEMIDLQAKQRWMMGENPDVINQETMEAHRQVEDDATKAGNFVFLANTVLITAANMIQFSKIWDSGYNYKQMVQAMLKPDPEKQINNVALGPRVMPKGEMYTRFLGSKVLEGLSEGGQELGQGAIQLVPEYYSGYNSFNESTYNPEKRELISDLASAMGKSFSEHLGDNQAAEEFAMGFLTSVLGIPTINTNSKTKLTVQNNIFYDLYENNKARKDAENLANTINTRLQEDDKFTAMYEGLVRHATYQDARNYFTDINDVFGEKNAEAAQLFSDMVMFDGAGLMANFKEMIASFGNITDEELESLVQESQSDNGTNQYKNADGTIKSNEEIRGILKERVGEIQDLVTEYNRVKEGLLIMFPGLSDEARKSLLVNQLHLNNIKDRKKSIIDRWYEEYSNITKDIDDLMLSRREFHKILNPTEKKREEGTENASDELTADEIYDILHNNVSIEKLPGVEKDLTDLNKLTGVTNTISAEIDKILNNPQKADEKKEEIKTKAKAKEDKKKESKEIDDLDALTEDELINPDPRDPNKHAELIANISNIITKISQIKDNPKVPKVIEKLKRVSDVTRLNSNLNNKMRLLADAQHTEKNYKKFIESLPVEMQKTIEALPEEVQSSLSADFANTVKSLALNIPNLSEYADYEKVKNVGYQSAYNEWTNTPKVDSAEIASNLNDETFMPAFKALATQYVIKTISDSIDADFSFGKRMPEKNPTTDTTTSKEKPTNDEVHESVDRKFESSTDLFTYLSNPEVKYRFAIKSYAFRYC